MFASTPQAYCRSLSRGGAILYASELQKTTARKSVTQSNSMQQLLQVVRGPVITHRRMRRRASVFVFTCVNSSKSTTQSPQSAEADGMSGTVCGAGRVTWRISAWCAVSRMQLWTIETSRQSVIQVGSMLLQYNDTCQTIIIPSSVCGGPIRTKSESDAIAKPRCKRGPRLADKFSTRTEMATDTKQNK